MKIIFVLPVFLISLFLMSCQQDLNSPLAKNIQHEKGVVAPFSGEEIIVNSFDIYHFGSLDSKTPASEGFKSGDYVYFEYEPGWSNTNSGGGTTFWCRLVLIRKG